MEQYIVPQWLLVYGTDLHGKTVRRYGPLLPGGGDTDCAITVCAAKRLVPLPPEEVKQRLETVLKFTGKGDIPKVTALYQVFFETVAPTSTWFDFARLAWGPSEAVELANVLPRFTSCTHLDLSNNQLGPEGAKSIAPAIAVMASITQVLAK